MIEMIDKVHVWADQMTGENEILRRQQYVIQNKALEIQTERAEREDSTYLDLKHDIEQIKHSLSNYFHFNKDDRHQQIMLDQILKNINDLR